MMPFAFVFIGLAAFNVYVAWEEFGDQQWYLTPAHLMLAFGCIGAAGYIAVS